MAVHILQDQFCQLLRCFYPECGTANFEIYGCINGHKVAHQVKEKTGVIISRFSRVKIIYPDNTLEEFDMATYNEM